MITLNQLRVFWAVAHSESLTRAAKQLGVTQPALSQQLAQARESAGRAAVRPDQQPARPERCRPIPAAQGRERCWRKWTRPRPAWPSIASAGGVASRSAPWHRSRARSWRTPIAKPWSSCPSSSWTCMSWRRPKRWSSSTGATCRWRSYPRSRLPPTGSRSRGLILRAIPMCSRYPADSS